MTERKFFNFCSQRKVFHQPDSHVSRKKTSVHSSAFEKEGKCHKKWGTNPSWHVEKIYLWAEDVSLKRKFNQGSLSQKGDGRTATREIHTWLFLFAESFPIVHPSGKISLRGWCIEGKGEGKIRHICSAKKEGNDMKLETKFSLPFSPRSQWRPNDVMRTIENQGGKEGVERAKSFSFKSP